MIRVPWRRRRWRGILAIVLSTPLLVAASVIWRASHATREAALEVLAKSEFSFKITPVDRVASAVEPIAATPGFRDIAAYKDMIAVSARAGLFLYDRNGGLLRSYRAGIELPPAELGSLSVGIEAGSAEPELFIATRGEGLLAFNGTGFRQILPADPALRVVTSVLVLGSGRILRDRNGRVLLVLDGRRLAPFHPRLKSTHITALAGNDGDLWIGTLDSGLFHYRAGQMEELLSALPDPQVLSLTVAGDAAYAGTPLGVVEFRGGQRGRTLADGFFARALATRGDTLYVGTEDEGIVDVPLQSRPSPLHPTEVEAPAVSISRMANLEGGIYAVGECAVYGYDAGPKRWRPVLTSGAAVMADRNVASLAFSGVSAFVIIWLLRAEVWTWWIRAWSMPCIMRTTRSSALTASSPTWNMRARRWPPRTAWCFSIPPLSRAR